MTHYLAEAAGRASSATGRVAIIVDKVDLTDRLRLQVEGDDVLESEVRNNLNNAYPELSHNIEIGNVVLEVETTVLLTDQFKAVKIADLRN